MVAGGGTAWRVGFTDSAGALGSLGAGGAFEVIPGGVAGAEGAADTGVTGAAIGSLAAGLFERVIGPLSHSSMFGFGGLEDATSSGEVPSSRMRPSK